MGNDASLLNSKLYSQADCHSDLINMPTEYHTKPASRSQAGTSPWGVRKSCKTVVLLTKSPNLQNLKPHLAHAQGRRLHLWYPTIAVYMSDARVNHLNVQNLRHPPKS